MHGHDHVCADLPHEELDTAVSVGPGARRDGQQRQFDVLALEDLEEEAAGVLGASRSRIFWKIIFPEIIPAALTGFGLAFGRCLGEYGSVVFIAGNKPFETEIVPLIIMSELQEYDYASATTIALVMLIASFVTLFLVNLVQTRNTKILKGGA